MPSLRHVFIAFNMHMRADCKFDTAEVYGPYTLSTCAFGRICNHECSEDFFAVVIITHSFAHDKAMGYDV